LGTVKAKEQIKVLPQTSGQLVLVNVKEGDYVRTGDVMFVIGGTNGRKHPTIIATQVAETNLATAQKALTATINGNAAALQASRLQLESANHALEGTTTDLAIMDRNMQGMDLGYTLTNDSYQRTVEKNSLDLEKIDYGLTQLTDGINALNNQRYSLEVTKNEQLDQISDPAAKEKAKAEFNTQLAALDTKINDLYNQLDIAKIGYESAGVALPITENQGEAALITTDTQRDVLAMQQLSAQQKLGMTDGSSDPVRIAEVGLQATQIKNDLTLAQAKAAVDLANLNVELSKASKEALWVKAPTDGIVTDVAVGIGDLVSPQVAVTSIINPKQFELKVAIDSDSADRIIIGSMGQVKIGGRYLDVPVSSVAPMVDSTSRLVSVTLKLPKIIFRPLQSLSAKIPVSNQLITSNGNIGQNSPQIISVPLDAVIIGTEEQYLYVIENGKAKKRTVKLGDINGSQVQVLEGISPDDRIIVDGAKTLTDGQSVQA
jgi:RND family efflux transporter MFP subunit